MSVSAHAGKNKTTAFLLSAFIIAMLILAGPAQGFSLNLTLDNQNPAQGNIITFTAEITIPAGEQLPIDFLNLELTGPETQTCKFTPQGQIIEGCKDITITPSQDANFGYGYGYNYFGFGYGYGYNFGYGYGYESGKLKYKITLNTANYQIGDYTTELKVKIQNNEFSEQGPGFTIHQVSSGGGGCRTAWQCTEWSKCTDGIQTRTCEKVKINCYADPAPEQTMTCTTESETLAGQNNQNQNEPIDLNLEQDDEQTKEQFVSRITGAVTGVVSDALNSKKGIIVLIMMVSIVAALSIVVWIKRIKYQKSNLSPSSFYHS
ncbi:MAG: hypothetical protein KJ718_01840 [Nanoarchaeota archaeon]|nr:hypothetical protein [Nanoarchaeota archaeon]MBU1051276.1 hypothetical protein [Nanoarchaeota archaeon]MBU1988898.1 hypothetical protein [Nanoarchaeota archaeon]